MLKVKNKIFIVLLIAILFTGCNVLKKKNVNKSDTKSEIKIDSSKKTIDKSKIEIIEQIDTVVKVPSKKIETDIPIDNLNKINNLTIVNDGLVKITQNYDSLKKVLNTIVEIDSQKIALKFNKKTLINNDIKTESNFKKDSTFANKSKTILTEKKKETNVSLTFIIISILSILIVGYFITKRYFL